MTSHQPRTAEMRVKVMSTSVPTQPLRTSLPLEPLQQFPCTPPSSPNTRCRPVRGSWAPWRAVGATQNGYFMEAFVDELARSLKKDPVALRRERVKRRVEDPLAGGAEAGGGSFGG